MPDQIRSDATLIAMLSDGAAAHSTNRQLIRDMLISLAVTGRINGISIDRHGDINIAIAAGSLTGTTLAANVVNSSLRFFGAAPVLDTPTLSTPTLVSPALSSPTITGPLTLDPTNPRIVTNTSGQLCLVNEANSDFFNIQFGGVSASYPALQKNGTGLTVGLANGSARSAIDAKRFTALGGPITEAAPVATTYTTSITINATLGNAFLITATNGTAFTINAPTGGIAGQMLYVIIKNTSGGALGVITWNAIFKMAAFTSPATGFQRVIPFRFDGTNYIDQRDVDVPN